MGLYLTEKHLKYKDGKDDHVSPFFIYHINNKRTKVFCGLKVNNKNWCFHKKKVKSTDFIQAAYNEGLIVVQAAGEKTIRLAPSLIISDKEINEGFKRFEKAYKNII